MIRPEIHFAHISDRYAIAYIDQRAQTDAGRVQCSPDFIDPIFEHSWEEIFDARTRSRGHRQIIVAKHFGVVIGFANFSFSNSRCCLVESIGVTEQYRNHGVGQSLLRTVINEIPEPKERIAVEIPNHFSDSITFFKRTGFEPTHRRCLTSGKNARLELDLSCR